MISNHHLGLHLPLKEELNQLIEDALAYNVSYFQFFLSQSQQKSNYIRPTVDQIKRFVADKQKHFMEAFIHSTYWINPATGNDFRFDIAKTLLKKEIVLAKKFEIRYLVLHPGSATWHKPTELDPSCKQGGIERVVSMLNGLLKKEHDIVILLENTAHGSRTIGSDLLDFKEIRNRLDYPERVGFCFDSAHAFAYGYDLTDALFMNLLDDTMGLANIKLVHFNDSLEPLSSRHDRHGLPGIGLIGKDTMQSFLVHEAFAQLPKIIEVTNVASKSIQQNIRDVRSW